MSLIVTVGEDDGAADSGAAALAVATTKMPEFGEKTRISYRQCGSIGGPGRALSGCLAVCAIDLVRSDNSTKYGCDHEPRP